MACIHAVVQGLIGELHHKDLLLELFRLGPKYSKITNSERSTDGTKLKLCFKQNCVLANSLLKLFGTNPLALGKVKRCPIVPGFLVWQRLAPCYQHINDKLTCTRNKSNLEQKRQRMKNQERTVGRGHCKEQRDFRSKAPSLLEPRVFDILQIFLCMCVITTLPDHYLVQKTRHFFASFVQKSHFYN